MCVSRRMMAWRYRTCQTICAVRHSIVRILRALGARKSRAIALSCAFRPFCGRYALADAAIKEKQVKLQVATLRAEESGAGIARIPRTAMAELGLTEGDVVQISAKRDTAARVVAPYPEDEGLEVIRLDGLQRANAGAGAGDMVALSRAEMRPATRVTFAPAQENLRLQGSAMALKRSFFGRPLVAGHDAVVLPATRQGRLAPALWEAGRVLAGITWVFPGGRNRAGRGSG